MNCIVNVTEDWGIGLGDQLLVAISADLRRFRQLTTGKTVILGRKTLATFPGGRPLKNRTNLVLSTNPAFTSEGAVTVHSPAELWEQCRLHDPKDLCVIGGASVYELLLPYCSTAQVTKTFLQPPADRFFPNLDALPGWSVAGVSPIQEENGVSFQYFDYVNANPLPLEQMASRP